MTSAHAIRGRCALLAAVACAVALAGAKGPPALAGDHRASTVPPTMELEVLDPRASPVGGPIVELNPDGEGGLVVDIPRTVVVHKLYYNGDRSFQAQLLPGGPTTVVVDHPRTGERCYIDMQLPPGAPRICYTGHAIEYDYGDHGVTLTFCRFCAPKVTYRNGTPLYRKAKNVAKAAAVGTAHAIAKTGIPEGVASVAQGTVTVAGNTVSMAGSVGVQLATPFVAAARATPLGSLAKRDPAREAENARKLAEHKRERQARITEASIETLR